MFNNIGTKIKKLTKALFVVEVIINAVCAIACWICELPFWTGLLVLVVGNLLAWVGSWIVYAIGDTNEKINYLYQEKDKIAVVVSKQNEKQKTVVDPYKMIYSAKSIDAIERETQVLNKGGWKCRCGRVNQNYVSSCACGKSKWDFHKTVLDGDTVADDE